MEGLQDAVLPRELWLQVLSHVGLSGFASIPVHYARDPPQGGDAAHAASLRSVVDMVHGQALQGGSWDNFWRSVCPVALCPIVLPSPPRQARRRCARWARRLVLVAAAASSCVCCTPLARALVLQLLQRAGVERNPGPRPYDEEAAARHRLQHMLRNHPPIRSWRVDRQMPLDEFAAVFFARSLDQHLSVLVARGMQCRDVLEMWRCMRAIGLPLRRVTLHAQLRYLRQVLEDDVDDVDDGEPRPLCFCSRCGIGRHSTPKCGESQREGRGAAAGRQRQGAPGAEMSDVAVQAMLQEATVALAKTADDYLCLEQRKGWSEGQEEQQSARTQGRPAGRAAAMPPQSLMPLEYRRRRLDLMRQFDRAVQAHSAACQVLGLQTSAGYQAQAARAEARKLYPGVSSPASSGTPSLPASPGERPPGAGSPDADMSWHPAPIDDSMTRALSIEPPRDDAWGVMRLDTPEAVALGSLRGLGKIRWVRLRPGQPVVIDTGTNWFSVREDVVDTVRMPVRSTCASMRIVTLAGYAREDRLLVGAHVNVCGYVFETTCLVHKHNSDEAPALVIPGWFEVLMGQRRDYGEPGNGRAWLDWSNHTHHDWRPQPLGLAVTFTQEGVPVDYALLTHILPSQQRVRGTPSRRRKWLLRFRSAARVAAGAVAICAALLRLL